MEEKYYDKKRQELKTGDLIEFKSLFHSHWGVYVGKGEVIHYRQVGRASLYDLLLRRHLTAVEKIQLQSLEKIKGKAYRNNFMDDFYEPRITTEIVKIAETILTCSPKAAQVYFLYHVHNCKQFALYCRYENVPESNEITLATVGTYALAGIVGIIIYSIFRRF